MDIWRARGAYIYIYRFMCNCKTRPFVDNWSRLIGRRYFFSWKLPVPSKHIYIYTHTHIYNWSHRWKFHGCIARLKAGFDWIFNRQYSCRWFFFNDFETISAFLTIYKIKQLWKLPEYYRATFEVTFNKTTTLHTNIRSVFTRCKYYLHTFFLENFFRNIYYMHSLQLLKDYSSSRRIINNLIGETIDLSRRYEPMPTLCFFYFFFSLSLSGCT